jgi:predicted CXXCH cytochrome family protein
VASLRCNQCHEAATSPTPFKTRRPGFELCRGCHAPMINETFSRNRIHWPLVDRIGCLNCHEPHAARINNLLIADMTTLCGRCHIDVTDTQIKLAEKEKQENLAAKNQVIKGAITHKPIQEGACMACHLPHSSDNVYLFKQASIIDGCGGCHDWLKHSSHPMGEKLVDPRNKNLRVNCLSCHRSHGTGYRYLIPYPDVTDLCVQCHKQFKR